ncbi:MAG: hypothetical protein ACQEVA_15705 [Myxococcota bacterium]
MKRAFAHLNLTRNPFGEPALHQRSRLAVVDVDAFVAALRQPGTYLEFRGAQGRGKSTRLHAIAGHIDDAEFVRVPEEPDLARRVELPGAAVVLVDDAQFLSDAQRRALFRRADSVAAATHDSLIAPAKEAGFDVEEVLVSGLQREELRAIVERRIEWARRGDNPVPTVTDAALEQLIASFGDDLRTIEDVLYSVFQKLEGAGDIGPAQIEDADVPNFTTDRS